MLITCIFYRLFTDYGKKNNTRRCSFVGCDVTGKNKPKEVQLLLLPKEDPDRSIWWINMGHSRDSLPAPKTARCCTRHMDTKVPRRLWRPVPGMLNVITRSTVSRDKESVARRRAEYEQ